MRQFTHWYIIPFLIIAWAFFGTEILAPDLLSQYVPTIFVVVILAMAGLLGLAVGGYLRWREGEGFGSAFHAIIVVLFVTIVQFGDGIVNFAYVLASGDFAGQFEEPAIIFSRADDGKFHPRLAIQDVLIDFVADTDMTEVVLNPNDAARAGINPQSLVFDRQIKIGGVAQSAAAVQLPSIGLGDRVMAEDVPALVLAGDQRSILGMAFFERTKGWEIEEDQLRLRF